MFTHNIEMGCISKVTMWIYVTHIIGTGECNEENVCAIAGYNATLAFTLGHSTFDMSLTTIDVYNPSGVRITTFNDGSCAIVNDSPLECITLNRGEGWALFVILINVTLANGGKYTSWIQYGLQEERLITKNVIIMDKPQIKKPSPIITGKPFNLTCATEVKLDHVTYQWKLNDTVVSSMHIYAISSILTFESPWMIDKSSTFSCEVCKANRCCIMSESFTLDPYSTSMAPSSLEPNIVASTVPSSPEHTDGQMHIWLGPVIVSALLLIVVVLILVTHWRKNTTRVIVVAGSSELCQLSAGRAHSEMSRKELEISNSPRPILTGHKNACRRTHASEIADVERNLGRLQNFFAESERLRNQFVENEPLQTLFKASNTMQRDTRDNAKSGCSFEQDNMNSSMGGTVCGNRLVNLLTRIKREKNVPRGDSIIGAQSQDLNISRNVHLGLKLHEGQYSNNAEDAISVFSNSTDKETEKHSPETGRSAEQVLYDNAHPVETVDVLEKDDSYITPISDLTRPIEMLQKKETDVLETDDTYISPINDFISHIEIFQGEGTDMNERDPAYITPISG